ncbi:tyrosine phosphatase family protein [Polycladidibacter hongkongensis]|uniref:tyrosine phosphatase family protein n=1 Tax=Polycladidibacter hongkongensis TaxID=1647556 RepID=UPI00082ACEC4|nr:hypothetical protein [Pseudovibrio hongkongensis]
MKLWVCPLSKLDTVLDQCESAAVLSLCSPGNAPSKPEHTNLSTWQQLVFHDVATPRKGLITVRQEQVAAGIATAQAIAAGPSSSTPSGTTKELVVHCWAGVSRSTAFAYTIACALSKAGAEGKLAHLLREASPEATPNPLVVHHGDNLLQRSGRMIEAIKGIGRGCDAFEGPVFCLELEQQIYRLIA